LYLILSIKHFLLQIAHLRWSITNSVEVHFEVLTYPSLLVRLWPSLVNV